VSKRSTTAAEETPSLQQQMDALNKLVEQLEDPELPLESALKLYESGMGLVRTAQAALEAAEQRVAVINEQGDAEPLD
jgi:exodeoxyribonuclease VII small subunit